MYSIRAFVANIFLEHGLKKCIKSEKFYLFLKFYKSVLLKNGPKGSGFEFQYWNFNNSCIRGFKLSLFLFP